MACEVNLLGTEYARQRGLLLSQIVDTPRNSPATIFACCDLIFYINMISQLRLYFEKH